MIEELKEYTEESMKIERAPWVPGDYTVNMDELYTELTVQQIDNKPHGPVYVKLKHYSHLFEEKATDTQQPLQNTEQSSELIKPKTRQKRKGRKILGKADPGMGKSTFCKKVAYDWAKGIFTAVSVVFFISMKLIQPGQTIENIIIAQTPPIEGLKFGEKKLTTILERLGSLCLIIFDGFDEYDYKSNDNIRKVIEGRQLMHCSILLTSRPHCVDKIGKYFPTQIRIEGFSRDHADRFVTCNALREDKKLDLLNFYNKNFTFVFANSNSFCPLMLLIMCVLTLGDEGFVDKVVPVGEVYMKLVLLVYRKFCVQRNHQFDENKFADFFRRTGKLAWKLLKSGQGRVSKDAISAEFGEDVFQFGLLIGHRNLGLSSKAGISDIQLTFGHVTIQEFLGSVGFLQLLDEGESVDSLLADDPEGHLVMNNPLFIRFCLWLLNGCQEEYIGFSHRDRIYDVLLCYAASFVNIVQLDMDEMSQIFSVLRVPFTDSEENALLLKFIKGILAKCDRVNEFYISGISYYPLHGLMELLKSFPPVVQESNFGKKSWTLLERSTNHIQQKKNL